MCGDIFCVQWDMRWPKLYGTCVVTYFVFNEICDDRSYMEHVWWHILCSMRYAMTEVIWNMCGDIFCVQWDMRWPKLYGTCVVTYFVFNETCDDRSYMEHVVTYFVFNETCDDLSYMEHVVTYFVFNETCDDRSYMEHVWWHILCSMRYAMTEVIWNKCGDIFCVQWDMRWPKLYGTCVVTYFVFNEICDDRSYMEHVWWHILCSMRHAMT